MRDVSASVQGFEKDGKSLGKGFEKGWGRVNEVKCLRHYGGLSLRYSPPAGPASRSRETEIQIEMT